MTFVLVHGTLKSSVFDTDMQEPMKDCSICVPDSANTQSIYVYIYRYIDIFKTFHHLYKL